MGPAAEINHPLASLFAATSVAVIGASERNQYAVNAIRNLEALKFSGPMHMVNPRGGTVFGHTAVASCLDIGEAVDAAYICVPLQAVMAAVRDATAAAIKNLVVLTSGFAETGGDGIQLQQALVEFCREHDVQFLGPNCLGFTNYTDGLSLGSIPVCLPQPPASLAIVSASGATAHQLTLYAQQCGIGVTHVIATGNEANVTTADCLDYLVSHPAVKSIAVFLETVRDPEKFAAVARKALQMQKPIVVLKVGESLTTAAVVAAHTGALVGDDRVFNAACAQLGIVRVSTFEDLITTSAAMASIGVLERSGVACVSISGGACEVMSDLAQSKGISLPEFAPATAQALRGVISELGQTHNPIDLTGAAVPKPVLWEQAVDIVSRDPRIGLVVCHFDLPVAADNQQMELHRCVAKAVGDAHSKACLITTTIAPVNEHGLRYFAENNLHPALQGLGNGMSAIGKLVWWSERLRRVATLTPALAMPAISASRPCSEWETLAYLKDASVPVIPSRLVTNAADAMAIARQIDGAVILKIASPDIAHKTDIGGVLLNLHGDEAVESGFRRIMQAAEKAHPAGRLDGVLVAPMRKQGMELLVGISRDPQWGLVMVLGLGGIWVEILQDSCLRILPITQADVIEALESLRAVKLLQGYRGARPVDFPALADVIVKIAAAATALGPNLAALEINPLLVDGDRIEALDALAVWEQTPAAPQ